MLSRSIVLEAYNTFESLIRETDEGLEVEGEPLLCCTTGARWMAKRFKGAVYGYEWGGNVAAAIGANEGGHDFAIVGDFIVDPWAHGYLDLKLILRISSKQDAYEITRRYGQTKSWAKVAEYNVRDKNWSREEVVLALDLYSRISFGQCNRRIHS